MSTEAKQQDTRMCDCVSVGRKNYESWVLLHFRLASREKNTKTITYRHQSSHHASVIHFLQLNTCHGINK